MTINLSVKVKPQDMWIGVYWEFSKSIESSYHRLKVWICFLPMIPVCLDIEWGWS